jgi:hypothetical protein
MSNGALSQNANSVDDRTAKRAAAKASQTTILRREIGWRLKAQYDALLAEPLPPRLAALVEKLESLPADSK